MRRSDRHWGHAAVVCVLLAGCVAEPEPAVPGSSSTPEAPWIALGRTETTFSGDFFIAGAVSQGGEPQYVTDGESRFEIPRNATRLQATLSWSSPIGAGFTFQLGTEEGGYLSEPVTGSSPLIIEANGSIPSGDAFIFVSAPGAVGATPYQAFHWDAIVRHEEDK